MSFLPAWLTPKVVLFQSKPRTAFLHTIVYKLKSILCCHQLLNYMHKKLKTDVFSTYLYLLQLPFHVSFASFSSFQTGNYLLHSNEDTSAYVFDVQLLPFHNIQLVPHVLTHATKMINGLLHIYSINILLVNVFIIRKKYPSRNIIDLIKKSV